MHFVLVNRLEDLSQLRNSVVGLPGRSDLTIAVAKTTTKIRLLDTAHHSLLTSETNNSAELKTSKIQTTSARVLI